MWSNLESSQPDLPKLREPYKGFIYMKQNPKTLHRNQYSQAVCRSLRKRYIEILVL